MLLALLQQGHSYCVTYELQRRLKDAVCGSTACWILVSNSAVKLMHFFIPRSTNSSVTPTGLIASPCITFLPFRSG